MDEGFLTKLVELRVLRIGRKLISDKYHASEVDFREIMLVSMLHHF